MPPNVYQTPGAFRQAVESRINARVSTNAEMQRLRRLIAFDRLLARLFADPSCRWIVKGGYSFEVRYGLSARTTKDIDLSLPTLDAKGESKATIQKL